MLGTNLDCGDCSCDGDGNGNGDGDGYSYGHGFGNGLGGGYGHGFGNGLGNGGGGGFTNGGVGFANNNSFVRAVLPAPVMHNEQTMTNMLAYFAGTP